MNLRDGNVRFIALILVVVVIFVAYGGKLYKMQIIDGDYYKEQSEKKIYSTETVTASRGNITDRNGQLLVTNETVYTIKFSRAMLPKSEQNDIILRLVQLVTQFGEKYNDTLPISSEAPFYYVLNDDTSQKRIDALVEKFGLDGTATAADLMQHD